MSDGNYPYPGAGGVDAAPGPGYNDNVLATDSPGPLDDSQVLSAVVGSTDGPPPLKPGWQTTEFWATTIFAVLTLLTGLGLIGPDFAKHHEALVNALALLASTIAPAAYAIARAITKHGHQQAEAHLRGVAMQTEARYGRAA